MSRRYSVNDFILIAEMTCPKDMSPGTQTDYDSYI